MSEEAVLAAEAARCAAINARDWEALAALLDEGYLHVHGNGRVTDKAATLARLAAVPRTIARGPLTVRLSADAALIVGEQHNRDGAAVTRAMVSQMLVRVEGAWRFASLHFTALHD